MKNKARTPAGLLAISPSEREAILDGIQHSIMVRRDAKLPLIDEQQVYQRELQLLVTGKYQAALESYLVDAYRHVRPQMGLPGRIAMTLQARRVAEAALFADQGIVNPDAAPSNVLKSMIRYTNGTMASLGI